MSKKKITENTEPVTLNIPDDEIWTYKVEGLSAPHINRPYKHYTLKKIVFTLVIIIAVSASCYFSVMTVQKDVFEYEQTKNGYELTKFSNPGSVTELDIDFVSEISYGSDGETDFSVVKDTDKKVTSIGRYAFNCDEKITVITVGKDVTHIDSKAFYSCYALRRIEVDEENPNYCDVDGVLYTKDMKRIICRPCDNDAYLAQQFGFSQTDETSENYSEYVDRVLTFVVPSTVETVGELCFNYAELKNVYLPEGLERIETLGFFKIPLLTGIYTYTGDSETSRFESAEALGTVYESLPESLRYIGSDAFSYNQSMTYVYIPENVEYIGHHAFWDTVYKDGKELFGVTKIYVADSEEDFAAVETGNNWKPQYDRLLFKKSVDTVFGAERGIR